MNATSPQPTALCAGIKELLDKALKAEPSNEICSKGTALALGGKEPKDRPNVDFFPIVEAMWRLIATNWVEGQCQWRGSENWRWEPCENLSVERPNRSEEVLLNRTLAQKLNKERWTNETPTASGLAEKGGREPGGLDLAYHCPPDRVRLIELKIRSNNPVYAAFQIVTYGLVLNLARLVHERLLHKNGPITISEQWRSANQADLLVLAPTSYYSEYPNLGWFEDQLKAGVVTFGKTQKLGMDFGFRRFDEKPTDEPQMLLALDRRVDWH